MVQFKHWGLRNEIAVVIEGDDVDSGQPFLVFDRKDAEEMTEVLLSADVMALVKLHDFLNENS